MDVLVSIWQFTKNSFKHIYFLILRALKRKKFISSILEDARSGIFTTEDKIKIQNRCLELDWTIEDLKSIRAKIYETVLSSIKEDDDYITAEQEVELNKIQQFFKIQNMEIIEFKEDLKRIRLLTEIKNGVPPSASVTNIILQKNEAAYWAESASLQETRVIGRRYVNGSRGASLRIAKGISYRFGSYPGHSVSEKSLVPVSEGQLIITNRRILFNGDLKSFDLKLDKILGLNFVDDGLLFSVGNRVKPYIVIVNDVKNVAIIRETLSLAMRNF